VEVLENREVSKRPTRALERHLEDNEIQREATLTRGQGGEVHFSNNDGSKRKGSERKGSR
jgi:hypothetical protein